MWPAGTGMHRGIAASRGGGARGTFKKKGVHMPRCGKMLTLLILTMSRPMGREGAGVTFVLGTRRSTPSSPGR